MAHIIGDSYTLSVEAGKADARYIVFCGVRFMAETAKILAKPEQHVYHPVIHAECEMAKMVTGTTLHHLYESNPVLKETFVPVVYVNTTADVKAFAGKYNGVTGTSSDAKKIASSILEKDKGVFFVPDKNLAMNVARSLNIGEKSVAFIRDRSIKNGPAEGNNVGINTAGDIDGGDTGTGSSEITETTRFCIWDGYCPVHHYMTPENVESARTTHPDAHVIVHPECRPQVVEKADFAGSTSQLLRYIEETASGSANYRGRQ